MKKSFLISLIVLFLSASFAHAQQNEEDSNLLDSSLGAVGILLSPLSPPAYLLYEKPEIKNRNKLRKRTPNVGAQVYSGSKGTSFGYSLSVPLSLDLNYWVVGLAQNQFLRENEKTETQTSALLEYRFFPYKKTSMSARLEASQWKLNETSENTAGFGFHFRYILNRHIHLYYSPNYTYWSKNKDISGNLAAGSYLFLGPIQLQLGGIYYINRNNLEDEFYLSLQFGLSL